MSASRLIAALACFLAPALSLAQTPPPIPPAPNAITAPAQKTIGVPSARKRSEALIVLNAQGAQAGRRHAHPRRRRTVGHPVRQPSGAQRRAHAHRRAGRAVGDRQLRQGSAQRHRLGLRQGRLQGHRRGRGAAVAEGRGRPAHLRRRRAGGKPGQCRRAGLGVHRHDLVRRRLGRLQLSRPEPDHRRHGLRRSAARATPAPSRGWSNPAPERPGLPASARTADFGPTRPRLPDDSPACGAPPLLPCY